MSISVPLYVFFAVLDIHFTLAGLNGDVSREGNPVMSYIMISYGVLGGLLVSKGLAAVSWMALRVW